MSVLPKDERPRTVQRSLLIDEELWRRAKIEAARQGSSVSAMVAEFIDEGLDIRETLRKLWPADYAAQETRRRLG